MISRRTIAAAAAGLLLGTLALAGCSGDSGSGDADREVTGTLNFYTDKAAWKPDFESLNEVSGEAVDI
ncbi:MAG: hypothetical protein K0R99_3155, partial [Microbacterium sp.]|nr:hypothetical protein [Microbacterium sp.]